MVSPEPLANTSTRLVVDASPDERCPMHGKNGSFQISTDRPSTKSTTTTSLRPGFDHRRGSSDHFGGQQSNSLDYIYSSNSVPRRGSRAQGPDRRASFQDKMSNSMARDKFRGKLDFKTILRKFDPKDEERGFGGGGRPVHQPGRSRHESEPREPHRNRGLIIDSDFDFRRGMSMEPDYNHPGKFRFRSSSAGQTVHRRSLRIDVDEANNPDRSIRRTESNPLSPRRVEFGEEIVFDFNPQIVGRPGVVSPTNVPLPSNFKPILRHTSSDPYGSCKRSADLTIHHTNPDSKSEDSGTTVQVLVTQQEDEPLSIQNIIDPHMELTSADESDLTDSDATLEDDEQPQTPTIRALPPMLDQWHRSQSFPPPATSHNNEPLGGSDEATRKLSLPEELLSSDTTQGEGSKCLQKFQIQPAWWWTKARARRRVCTDTCTAKAWPLFA